MHIYRASDKTKETVCLSFCVDVSCMNLYGMSLGQVDYYLIYRIAHATCVYTIPSMDIHALRHANQKLLTYVPFFSSPISPSSCHIQHSFGLHILCFVSRIIYELWSCAILYNAQKSPLKHQGLLCTSSICKVYLDKRAIYNRAIKKKLV